MPDGIEATGHSGRRGKIGITQPDQQGRILLTKRLTCRNTVGSSCPGSDDMSRPELQETGDYGNQSYHQNGLDAEMIDGNCPGRHNQTYP